MKLCRDCKHARPWITGLFWFRKMDYELGRCASPQQPNVVNLASGVVKEQYCDNLRHDYSHTETCGSDGKWFEPKDSK